MSDQKQAYEGTEEPDGPDRTVIMILGGRVLADARSISSRSLFAPCIADATVISLPGTGMQLSDARRFKFVPMNIENE